jgi:biopolymer transport protein ExbD
MNFKRPVKKTSAMEIAPLVDVIFLLLLFFVLSYNAAGESAIVVTLPPSSEADQTVPDEIIITIQADGNTFLGESAIPLMELAARLGRIRQHEGNQAVTIRADQRVDVGTLVSVIDATKAAGFYSFNIVARTDG